MKANVMKTGEIVEVERVIDDNNNSTYFSPTNPEDDRTWEPYELEVFEPEKAVIEGYAVKWHDGEVTVFQQEPTRLITPDSPHCGWSSQDGCKLFLPKDSLLSLTPQNSPQRVRIEITLIDEKGE